METEKGQLEQQHIRRRTFLVDRKFQIRYTLIIVLVGVVVSALLGFFILRLTKENTELIGMDQVMMEQAQKVDSYSIYLLIGFVAAMAIALFIWGIFITHRVAGPIFIISRSLRQIAEGKIPTMRPLRRGDELQEFFDTFANMLAALRHRHIEEAEIIEKSASEINAKGGNALSDTAKALINLAQKKREFGEG